MIEIRIQMQIQVSTLFCHHRLYILRPVGCPLGDPNIMICGTVVSANKILTNLDLILVLMPRVNLI